VRLWSRNGKDFTATFPDIQAALVDQVDTDCVLDRELEVCGGADRLRRIAGEDGERRRDGAPPPAGQPRAHRTGADPTTSVALGAVLELVPIVANVGTAVVPYAVY
jgi:hypothetical protein